MTARKRSRHDPKAALPPPVVRPSPGALLAPVIIVVVVNAAYANSFKGVFLFDDSVHIVQNARVLDLWSPAVLTGNRPTVDVSVAVNRALDGLRPVGYHAFNLLVHLVAALTLYGIVRRTLVGRACSRHFERSAGWLALTIALLWAVHPLQTQSVTYVIQRAESMMGMFYLLTLYLVIRGTGILPVGPSSRRMWWYAASVLACAFGMGCKAVMVTAPVAVFLYDSFFVSGSTTSGSPFVQPLRRRWALYVGLAATWSVLWACGIAGGVLTTSNAGAHVGFGFKGITPLEYALTQFGVLVEYLRLSVWPYPLCLDYNWPVARSAGAVVPAAVVITGLIAITFWSVLSRAVLGFAGVWFFLILAPTSSVVPIKDTLFEHRMYLPLAGVMTLLVLGGHRVAHFLADRLPPQAALPAASGSTWVTAMRHGMTVAVVLVVGSFGWATARRNMTYQSGLAMWRDVAAKRPQNARAFENLGTQLMASSRNASLSDSDRSASFGEAIIHYRRAVTLDPDFASAHANLANALSESRRPEKAVHHYEEVLRVQPNHVRARVNLGHALGALGRSDESLNAFREATRVHPRYTTPDVLANAHFNLGGALGRQGDLAGAEAQYRQAVALWPEYERAQVGLGSLLLRKEHYAEAIERFDRTLEINPNNARAREARSRALARLRGEKP